MDGFSCPRYSAIARADSPRLVERGGHGLTDGRLPFYRAQGLVDENGDTVIDPGAGKKTAAQGAATIVFAAASPLLADIGGVYLKDNNIALLDDNDRPLTATSIPAEADSAMLDPDDAHRLWAVSAELLSQQH
jgi:hypothetical protein